MHTHPDATASNPVTKNPPAAVSPAPSFTPGPWSVLNGDVVAPGQMRGELVDVASVYLTMDEEGELNGNLIAAAPDLLAALRVLIHAVECNPEPTTMHLQRCLSDARFQVIKAEGRS